MGVLDPSTPVRVGRAMPGGPLARLAYTQRSGGAGWLRRPHVHQSAGTPGHARSRAVYGTTSLSTRRRLWQSALRGHRVDQAISAQRVTSPDRQSSDRLT